MTRLINKKHLAVIGAAVLLGLQGCVPLVFVGGAAVGVLVGTDPRPAETMKGDLDLGGKISATIIDTWKDQAHVNVNTFNSNILLTGEVPDEAARARVQQIAQSQTGVRHVYNETVVAPLSSTTDRLNDTQLTTRVKASIIGQGGDTSGFHLMVVTERKVVYLMGIAKPDVANQSAQAASLVSGVEQVVKLVEFQPQGPADRAN
ncbi:MULTISPECIES: BON domain-containing protein [Silvimonas]|uniref:BON domain-containing protein n=1 Tax=Silvimonas TaxID=300264 RepID=UPI0024B3311F|nr:MULTISPECIES: BON domain-containing protein [Silvimonas]MDR3427186.1 BON domain-containing protein [Silvimonas sp.]